MRRLSRPEFGQHAVFAACLQGVGDEAIATRVSVLAPQMLTQEQVYEQLASTEQLHRLGSHPSGGDGLICIGNVTRGECKGLYTNQMARAGKPARTFYDQLRVSAPNSICPYCGIGAVETLDHFLPKGNYSSLSVLPLNLVPACRDCNTGKHAGAVSEDSMSSHPYFEHQCVQDDEWLLAAIVCDQVIRIEYRVQTPTQWPSSVSSRVRNHFSTLDLSRRYSVQAAGKITYYAQLINGLVMGGAQNNVARMLEIMSVSDSGAYGINSWQAALAKAVANDEWFFRHGYTQLL